MILLMAASICSHGQERVTAAEELIKGLDGKLSAAMLQGDSKTVDELLAEDYIEINAQAVLSSKADLMAIVRARSAAPRSKSVGPEVTIDETSFRLHGATAVLSGRITTRYQFLDYQTSPDSPQSATPMNTEQERFMKVYSKRDGRWQLVASTRTAIAKR